MTAKKTKKTTAVTTTTDNSVAVSAEVQALHDELLDGESAPDMEDVKLGSVLMMQGQSKWMTEEVPGEGDFAGLGEIRDSITGELYANAGEEVEMVLFHQEKIWIRSVDNGEGYEFQGIEPYTAENKDLPWKTEREKNERTMRYYGFVVKPDQDPSEMWPVTISCKSTSFKSAAEPIETQRAKLQLFKKPLCAVKFAFTPVKKTKEIGKSKATYFVWQVRKSGTTSPEILQVCAEWKKLIRTTNVTVDDDYSHGDEESFTSQNEPTHYEDVAPSDIPAF